MVRDLRRSEDADAAYPPILFVHQGMEEQGEEWFGGLWPEARAIADPEARFYGLFGIGQAATTPGALFGAVACGVRATLKGNRQRGVGGDPALKPGICAFAGERLIWQHDFRHVGDHPDFARLPDLVERAATTAR